MLTKQELAAGVWTGPMPPNRRRSFRRYLGAWLVAVATRCQTQRRRHSRQGGGTASGWLALWWTTGSASQLIGCACWRPPGEHMIGGAMQFWRRSSGSGASCPIKPQQDAQESNSPAMHSHDVFINGCMCTYACRTCACAAPPLQVSQAARAVHGSGRLEPCRQQGAHARPRRCCARCQAQLPGVWALRTGGPLSAGGEGSQASNDRASPSCAPLGCHCRLHRLRLLPLSQVCVDGDYRRTCFGCCRAGRLLPSARRASGACWRRPR